MQNATVIGILCVDIAKKLTEEFGGEFKSYIAASYVKFLESAGAKVIPIWIGRPQSYYQEVLKKINGILLPGGALWFTDPNGYAEAGRNIYKIAVEMNENGEYFPLWGTCLGYELLLYASADGKDPRQDCASMNDSLPLLFKDNFRTSRLYKNLPTELETILRTENVTYNIHRYCVTEEDLTTYGIKNEWRILSTNKDKNGLEFISSIEHEKYPFYGIQFHPEKSAYELSDSGNICHSENAIRVSQYFAHFFIKESKKNKNRFQNEKEEYRHLIYSFPVYFTGARNLKWFQCYLFTGDSDYPEVL